MPNPFTRTRHFLRFLLQRFNEDRCPQVAASLTYTTLLALVPIITIVLTIVSAFPVFTQLMSQIKVFLLTNMLPESAGKIISVYMQQFSEKAARLTVLGILMLAATAFMLMLTIDHAFNVIWRTHRRRSLLHRFLIYWATLTLGPLLIGASLSITSYLVTRSLDLVDVPWISVTVLKLVPVALTIIAFALLYRVVPERWVSPRHALIAGTVAGILFELTKKIFTLYLTQFPTYTLVYGAFAAVPIFLVWVYLSWLVVLIGAVIAAALPHWDNDDWQVKRPAGSRFYDALRLLALLHDAQQTGKALGIAELHHATRLGSDDIEDILEQMRVSGWVSRDADNACWMLRTDPEHIQIIELYRQFAFNPTPPAHFTVELQAALPGWLRTPCPADGGGVSLKTLLDAAKMP